ncbi:MAG: mandelate racemase/muconate lactonizing enzyme family protein [Rhodobacteraceae bacterium]|nr:mandelate racemase/muconate lactonizing enzyme family protein [Paracoccaceae bacterium]
MKLDSLEVFVVGNRPPGWGGRYFTIVKLVTECGIAGFGEVYAASVGPSAMTAVIHDVFERHMHGESPDRIEIMFRRAYSSGFSQRPDPTVMGAFSGLEIACWDILGKAHDIPVHAFLGGLVNQRIRSYSYVYPLPHHDLKAFWNSPDMTAEAAEHMIDLGFTAVKFDPAGPYTVRGAHEPAMRDIDRSVQFCRRLRDAVGDQADLLFGTHGQFTTSGAIRLGNAIAPYSPLWFEEPVPPDNVKEFSRVARSCSVPLAAGERLTTKSEFFALLDSGSVSIVQPALGRCGGILEGKKISALAEVFNALVAPHLYAGPVEWAANVQLAACIPNLLMVETIETGGEFHRRLIGDTISWEQGFIEPPDAPGLGIEFNEELARQNPYTGRELHLEMQEAPCSYDSENRFAGGAPPTSPD